MTSDEEAMIAAGLLLLRCYLWRGACTRRGIDLPHEFGSNLHVVRRVEWQQTTPHPLAMWLCSTTTATPDHLADRSRTISKTNGLRMTVLCFTEVFECTWKLLPAASSEAEARWALRALLDMNSQWWEVTEYKYFVTQDFSAICTWLRQWAS